MITTLNICVRYSSGSPSCTGILRTVSIHVLQSTSGLSPARSITLTRPTYHLGYALLQPLETWIIENAGVSCYGICSSSSSYPQARPSLYRLQYFTTPISPLSRAKLAIHSLSTLPLSCLVGPIKASSRLHRI